ncbi:MAG: ABC transporter permease [Lachnospiraceae bacterium]
MKRAFLKNKPAVAGVVVLLLVVLLSILVPMCSPYSYEEQHIENQNEKASFQHPFGTDKFGRDIFVRVFYGARISLMVGFASAFLNMVIAVLYGGTAGYLGGRIDMVFMQLADILYAVPSLLYMILILLVRGANMSSIILGICIAGWIETARILRGEIRRLKEQEFCLAARLCGATKGRIFFHHLLPHLYGQMIVSMTCLIPQAMFMESFLSFLGVGISAPAASLGTLLQDARSQIGVAPMQLLYPMICLCLIIIALNFAGDGLLQALNPESEDSI